VDIGTGTEPSAPSAASADQRRSAAVNSLGEWLSVLWLTPAMDRLFTGAPATGGASSTAWCSRSNRATRTIRRATTRRCGRATSCSRSRNAPIRVAGALEEAMAEHGARIAEARRARSRWRDGSRAPEDEFARARSRSKVGGGDLPRLLRANRSRDAAAADAPRAASPGSRRTHRAKQMRRRISTGEQKALLLGLVLAHAELVAERRGEPPILLLDEVAAHLDPKRARGPVQPARRRGQVWMTATEAALFEASASARASTSSRDHLPSARWTS
jgi:DNA replication and repair protein RecF